MFTEAMLESIKKVEATRAARMATEPRRMTAEEKSELLKAYHPDYRPEGFAEIKIGPNKGQKAPLELTQLLHSNSRLLNEKIDLENPAYDVDVLVIGGGGAGIFYYLKFVKGKNENFNLEDDLDFYDDEDYENEDEVEECDEPDTSDDTEDEDVGDIEEDI